MIHDVMYIELKTGYSDDGPAWIGYVKTSKSKKTIYFNDHAFQKNIGNCANYIDIEIIIFPCPAQWRGILDFRTEKGREQSPLGRAWKNYDRPPSG